MLGNSRNEWIAWARAAGHDSDWRFHRANSQKSYPRRGARKTIKKRMRARLVAIKMELRKTMRDVIAKADAWMKRMLQGHLNYFAVSGNHPSPWWFVNTVKRP
jgi:hypothetical protein